MRLLLAFLAGLLLHSTAAAQTAPAYWFTDMPAAQAFAQAHEAPILVVFAGSDWCRPCIQFKQDILLAAAFDVYAQTNLVVLYLDFPARRQNQLAPMQKAHNEALAERYNPTGAFPGLVVIDYAGQVLGTPEFKNQSADAFVALLQALSTTTHP